MDLPISIVDYMSPSNAIQMWLSLIITECFYFIRTVFQREHINTIEPPVSNGWDGWMDGRTDGRTDGRKYI